MSDKFGYLDELKQVDPEIHQVLVDEAQRQHSQLELIASENFVPGPVLLAAGSVLTNKYAEGYPGKRYYGGCKHVDVAENLAIDRAKDLFGADHANVQPHAGAQANLAVYYAFLEPGDTFMGLELSHGGHLTHGHFVSITGNWFDCQQYRVDAESHRIDFDYLMEQAEEHDPELIMAGASAYPLAFQWDKFREVADAVDAVLVADIAHYAGLVAAGLYPNPFPAADVVTTTIHKTLRGPRSGMVLCKEEHAEDIDQAVFPGTQGGPMMHIIAAKATALKIAQTEEFDDYQQRIKDNAETLGEVLQERGFKLIGGGTESHLLLVDVKSSIGETGKHCEERLDEIDVTVNKNTIPYDEESPFVTSGIRLGTPALTTRGFGAEEFAEVGDIIADALKEKQSDEELRSRVKDLIEAHPLYEEWWN